MNWKSRLKLHFASRRAAEPAARASEAASDFIHGIAFKAFTQVRDALRAEGVDAVLGHSHLDGDAHVGWNLFDRGDVAPERFFVTLQALDGRVRVTGPKGRAWSSRLDGLPLSTVTLEALCDELVSAYAAPMAAAP